MPSTLPASADERRAAAQAARLGRARRVARLRRGVAATALATFALAFGVIAYDGSMGSTTASGSGAAAITSSARQSGDDGVRAAPNDTSVSSQPLTTSQS